MGRTVPVVFVFCLLVLCLGGCRDALSEREEKPVEPDVPDEGGRELATAAAEAAGSPEEEAPTGPYWSSSFSHWSGAVPFHLSSASGGSEGSRYVLTGYSLDGEGQFADSFESYLRSGRGMRELGMTGARVESSPGKMVVHAQSDLVLSFESIAADEPVEIQTHGHDLLLIADRIGDLQVQTTEPGRDAGSVAVLAMRSSGVRYDLRGAAGSDGSDGLCPAGFPGCLSDRSLKFPGRSLAYSLVDADPEEDIKPAESLVDEMSEEKELVAEGSPSDGGCPRARATQVRRKEDWEGAVRTVWKKKKVVWSDDRVGNAAYLSLGQPGSSGHGGGTLRLVVPDLLVESVAPTPDVYTSGGAAGRHGRHGWVGAEPAPLATPIQVVHDVEHDARSVKRIVTLRYTWLRFERRGLPAGGGSTCGVIILPLEKSLVERPRRPFWSEQVTEVVHPPETFEGERLGLPDLPQARRGSDGRIIRASLAEADLWALVGQKIPLPDSVSWALDESIVSKE